MFHKSRDLRVVHFVFCGHKCNEFSSFFFDYGTCTNLFFCKNGTFFRIYQMQGHF